MFKLIIESIVKSDKFAKFVLWLGAIPALITIYEIAILAAKSFGITPEKWVIGDFNGDYLAIALFVLLLLVIIQLRLKLCKQAYASKKIIYDYQRSLEKSMDVIGDIISSLKTAKNNEQLSGDQLSNLDTRVMKSITDICTRTASIMEMVVGADVHICIKILIDDIVSVRGRSVKRGIVRTLAPHEFKATANTAFRYILSAGKPPFYLNNSLSKDSSYKNIHKDWQDWYDKTLVVAIYNKQNKILGFMCADSLRGSFNADECLHILQAAGFQIRSIVEAHDRLNSSESE